MFHFNESLRIDQRYVEAYLDRGLLWVGSGQFDYAIADYQNALEIAPRSPRALGRMAWLRAISPTRGSATARRPSAWPNWRCRFPAGPIWRPSMLWPPPMPKRAVSPRPFKRLKKPWVGHRAEEACNRPALRERITLYQAGSPYHLPPCK